MEQTNDQHSRRLFLRKLGTAGLLFFTGGALLAACNNKSSTKEEEFNCDDFSKVSADELDKRKKLGYEEKASDPEKECVKCNLFIPKGEKKDCGGCILFKGPVRKTGSCTYWAEQVN